MERLITFPLEVEMNGIPQLEALCSIMGRMKSVTIAVATTDRVSLADHLARSSAFFVYRADEGQVVACGIRERGTDACGNHATFVDLLAGCDAVLCGGISTGAEQLLAAHGIEPVVAASKHTIEEAVVLYLKGALPTTSHRVCLCH